MNPVKVVSLCIKTSYALAKKEPLRSLVQSTMAKAATVALPLLEVFWCWAPARHFFTTLQGTTILI